MAFPILGALKLAINAGSHIYKKKQETKKVTSWDMRKNQWQGLKHQALSRRRLKSEGEDNGKNGNSCQH